MTEGKRPLTSEELAVVRDLRRALETASRSFAVAVTTQNWPEAEKWSGLAFGLVGLMEAQPADA